MNQNNDIPVMTPDMSAAGNTAGDIIASGQSLQQIKTSYATAVAVQRPRNLVVVQKRCLEEAALAGEACYYGWGKGKDRVEGPSKECAMIAARNWGNVALEMRPVSENIDSYILEAGFIDLETGFTYTRQFRQSKKWKVHGKMDEMRKDDIRFQIGQSKAQRNCILNALPNWLISKMMDRAKRGVKEALEEYIKDNSLETARQLVVKALSKHSVTVEDIENKYEVKYGGWDVDLLVILKGDISALNSGSESPESLYPKPEPTKTDQVADKIAKKAATVNKTTGEVSDSVSDTKTEPEPDAEIEPEPEKTVESKPKTEETKTEDSPVEKDLPEEF